jgi:acetyltransferase-like isoleucine patch superfamily enzyme
MIVMSFFFSKVFDKVVVNSKKPIWYLINYLNFRISSISYKSFPKIIGFVVLKNRGKISFGSNININSYKYGNPVGFNDKTYLFCSPKGCMEIGNNVSMSRVLIFSQEHIIIEDNVMIGGGVQILDSDFHPLNSKERMIDDISKIKTKRIIIKKGSFIGANTIILKGAVIGVNSVIGAGSVVSSKVPDNEIWGGNPAKFLKKI